MSNNTSKTIADHVKEKAEISLHQSSNFNTIRRVKSYFIDEKEANEFANEVNGTVYEVDFLGGYEVYYLPDKI